MKWYKKQLDKLKVESPDAVDTKKNSRNSLAAKKTGISKTTFVNPVKASKLSRPKTDSK